jgi:hypothetical protein
VRISEHERKKMLRDVETRLKALSIKPASFDQLVMAERAEQARLLCHEAYRLYDRRLGRDDEEAVWKKASALFRQATDEAYPPGFWESFAKLKKGDSRGVEQAIIFLEKDPWFFGSGYVKADLLRFIRKHPLSNDDAQRLRAVVIAAVKLRDRREFKYYCRVSRYVDSPEFQADLQALSRHPDADVQRRARWVISATSQKISS